MTQHPSDKALKPLTLALLVLATSACSRPTPAERKAAEAQNERIFHQRRIDDAYDRCINRVVGAFSSASIEIMRECKRQSRLVP